MEFFYMIVLAIAVLFLIIMLTYIGILMRYTDTKVAFPPIENDCPDYWVLASDGKSCTIPTNDQKNAGTLYTSDDDIADSKADIDITTNDTDSFPTKTPGYDSGNNRIDFTNDDWSSQGMTSTCAKKFWANNWKITWDGITNTNTC